MRSEWAILTVSSQLHENGQVPSSTIQVASSSFPCCKQEKLTHFIYLHRLWVSHAEQRRVWISMSHLAFLLFLRLTMKANPNLGNYMVSTLQRYWSFSISYVASIFKWIYVRGIVAMLIQYWSKIDSSGTGLNLAGTLRWCCAAVERSKSCHNYGNLISDIQLRCFIFNSRLIWESLDVIKRVWFVNGVPSLGDP